MEMNEFLKANEGLVRLTIFKMFGSDYSADRVAAKYNMTVDDLKQVARIELWNSKLKFDESKGYTFSTYAVKNMKYLIMRELRFRGHAIKVPLQHDIADFSFTYIPGDREVNEEGDSIFSLIGSDYDLEEEVMLPVEQQEKRELLQRVLSDLKPKERNIIILRLQGKSFREIGQRYLRSHQAISKMYRNTLDRLKEKYA